MKEELDELQDDPEFELEVLLLSLNESIIDRMKDLGLRNVDLAKRLGVSRAFVTKLLNGNENLKLGTLIRIANALGTKVEINLLPREGEPKLAELQAKRDARKQMASAIKR